MSPSPTAAADWADVVEQVQRSTVRIDVLTCDGERGMGSGFVVGDKLVMTAAHVVDQAGSISLQVDGTVRTAQVIDIDFDADVALLRAEDSLAEPALTLAPEKVRLGSELAVLGFPNLVQDLRVTRGVVSSLNFQLSYEGRFTIKNPVMVTDAAINGGNSGGPVVDRTGSVIGLVTGKQLLLADLKTSSEGTAYVVPSVDLDDRLAQWQSQDPMKSQCGESGGDEGRADLIRAENNSDHPDSADITQVLALHGEGINRGQYEAAFSLFTDSMQRRQGGAGEWSTGLNTSYWLSLAVDDVTREGNVATVKVRFRTNQEARYGHKGQTCSDWSQTRKLVLVEGIWLIDQVKNEAGSPSNCSA